MTKKRNTDLLYFLLALSLYSVFFYFVMASGRNLDFGSYLPYSKVIIEGWFRTLLISLLAMVLALVVGLILYLMSESRFKLLHYIAVIHKNIIFGTPLLVVAIVSYYLIANSLGFGNKLLVGSLTLAFYIGAYVSDIYKGSIESVHINQWQTAKMFGFTKYQTYRYVVLPQVVLTALPPLAGQLALTIKGSALLSYLAVPEYYNEVNNVIQTNYKYVEGYIIMATGYLLITIPLIRLVRYLEVKLNYKI